MSAVELHKLTSDAASSPEHARACGYVSSPVECLLAAAGGTIQLSEGLVHVLSQRRLLPLCYTVNHPMGMRSLSCGIDQHWCPFWSGRGRQYSHTAIR